MTEPGSFGLRGSVRVRLLLMALFPLLLVMPLLLWLTVSNLSDRFDDLLSAKVRSELTIARQHLDGLMDARLAAIAALGQSRAMATPPNADFLAAQAKEMGLDFLRLMPEAACSDTLWPVRQAACAGQAHVALDIFTAEKLAAISADLSARAALALVPTAAASPTDRRTETRGMMIHAAAPAPGGVLVGGVLLNRNLRFIDEINDLVYPVTPRNEHGTATLFLEDVRISTNVRMFDGVRALGTRVSAAVRGRVLERGESWSERAFVVDDWYISAYEPVSDSFDARIGMLYVGFLERPFIEAQARTIRFLALGAAAAFAVTLAILLWWAQGIFRPLERMTATIAQVDRGNLAARTGPMNRHDEIARVAARLDDLLDQLAAREASLRELNETLEKRVRARTTELEAANQRLKAATGQLVLSEKLASIGELAAGVAHEINNPLAVIQGNLDVIQQELGPAARPLDTEFRLIFEQAEAIGKLVGQLLHFARPDEFSGQSGVDDLDGALRRVEPLIRHLLTDHELELDLAAGCGVRLATTQLQQIVVNLCRNGIDAMPDGGRLTIRARRRGDMAQIEVIDTGGGMDAAVQARIFDPFFTTKPASGTGLGLSICKDAITSAGGDITVHSAPGAGSRFCISLPVYAPAG